MHLPALICPAYSKGLSARREESAFRTLQRRQASRLHRRGLEVPSRVVLIILPVR